MAHKDPAFCRRAPHAAGEAQRRREAITTSGAPRAASATSHQIVVIVSHGAAGLVQSETSAFIAADGAFCLIALAGGVVSGALGYVLGVRRYGPLPMVGVLAGALAAGFLARWVGEQPGSGMFHHLLATLPVGAHLTIR